ncbi:hypothetical protein JW935_11555, partial [candidate division KSB1 bacterium]|nr:hypothetical protein [candidate division KSB1 bacterium]
PFGVELLFVLASNKRFLEIDSQETADGFYTFSKSGKEVLGELIEKGMSDPEITFGIAAYLITTVGENYDN